MLADGLLERHLPAVRARYKAQRDAMQAALRARICPRGCHWVRPGGGMFFWVELPAGLDATALLPRRWPPASPTCPARPSYAGPPAVNTLRLSFVTVSPQRIEAGRGGAAARRS